MSRNFCSASVLRQICSALPLPLEPHHGQGWTPGQQVPSARHRGAVPGVSGSQGWLSACVGTAGVVYFPLHGNHRTPFPGSESRGHSGVLGHG